MGGRVSVPRGVAGTTESSKLGVTTTTPTGSGAAQPKRPQRFNTRALLVPVAAAALAGIFFVYSRTSVQAAKENARRHREADGGSISWRNESLRRHGAVERPRERTLWQQLSEGGSPGKDGAAAEGSAADAEQRTRLRADALSRARRERNPIEEGIRRAREDAARQNRDI